MKIAGLQPCSLLDFPGHIAAIVFTPGCNMNCHYCHNAALLKPQVGKAPHDPESILRWLMRRQGKLDGVVVSGGEPTLQTGLEEFIRGIRDLGMAVKLDTNGTRPEVLKALLDEGLLDYVAMDLKAPKDRYADICGVAVDTNAVQESMELLLENRVPYEFRTTFTPLLSQDDVMRLGSSLQGAQRWVLQQYRPSNGSHFVTNRPIPEMPHSNALVRQTQEMASSHFHIAVQVRGL